jgi:hypothetical protein
MDVEKYNGMGIEIERMNVEIYNGSMLKYTTDGY